ncbi:MAG TPA: hypothetical protein VGM23_11720 [Armatimonadota bacterium]|jgi:hypothetical protein
MKKLCMLGLLLATSFAFAVPTQLGFSGGFTVPNADIQQGTSLTMTFDDSQNYQEIYGEGHTRIPLTQLGFNLGQSLEVCLGFQEMATTSSMSISPFSRAPGDATFRTWNASLKYGLPYTLWKGKLALGIDYQSTSSSYDMVDSGMVRSRESGGDDRWIGLLAGTFPVFTNATFSTALLFTDNDTSYAFGLEKGLPGKAAVGVEYILNSPLYYHIGSDDFGTVYAKIPFGDMFTGRLALTGINDEAKLAASLTAAF